MIANVQLSLTALVYHIHKNNNRQEYNDYNGRTCKVLVQCILDEQSHRRRNIKELNIQFNFVVGDVTKSIYLVRTCHFLISTYV